MARKDGMSKMRQLLVMRRDALRKALAGDLSLLEQLREQSAGDVVDFALDSAQDEINSQLAEVESRRRGLTALWLNVFGPNVVARQLYESLGYVETGRKELDGRSIVAMRKQLA